jgi:hypothetical protein
MADPVLRQKKMVSNVVCLENSKFKFQDSYYLLPNIKLGSWLAITIIFLVGHSVLATPLFMSLILYFLEMSRFEPRECLKQASKRVTNLVIKCFQRNDDISKSSLL